MKTCASCRFYSENQEVPRHPQSCANPELPNLAEMILGYKDERAQIQCLHVRLSEKLCGIDGQWWEAHS